MKHQRARRLVGGQSETLAAHGKIGAAIQTTDASRASAKLEPTNVTSSACTPHAGSSAAQVLVNESSRKLPSPTFVSKRQSGGTFKSDPLASLLVQPKDYVRLRQRGMVRWRLNKWAQDLLDYTQAQQAAKVRANALLEIGTTELGAPPIPTSIHSKLSQGLTREGHSLVVGFCVQDAPVDAFTASD